MVLDLFEFGENILVHQNRTLHVFSLNVVTMGNKMVVSIQKTNKFSNLFPPINTLLNTTAKMFSKQFFLKISQF